MKKLSDTLLRLFWPKLTLNINSFFPFSINGLRLLLEPHRPNWKFFAKVCEFSKLFLVLNSLIIKTEREVLSKTCCFYLWVFKIYLKNSYFYPISFKDLNIYLVSWNFSWNLVFLQLLQRIKSPFCFKLTIFEI